MFVLNTKTHTTPKQQKRAPDQPALLSSASSGDPQPQALKLRDPLEFRVLEGFYTVQYGFCKGVIRVPGGF